MSNNITLERQPLASSLSNRLMPLCPVQQQAFDRINAALPACEYIGVTGYYGSGKSLVLRHLRERWGGRILTSAEAMRVMEEARPDQLEEALLEMVERALVGHDIVYVEDWWDIQKVGEYFGERPLIIWNLMISLRHRLAAAGKKMVESGGFGGPWMHEGAAGVEVTIEPFGEADRQAILEYHLGKPIAAEEMRRLQALHRGGQGYQLAAVGASLRSTASGPITAEMIADLLMGVAESGNVTLGEVEKLSADDLVGAEAHFELLDRTVLLPMTQPDMARELGMQPARGVLLHGSPGTGKTTIGRVLAHRMKGKFFLIDGTVFSDQKDMFMSTVNGILASAAACAPAVVFIDDADVIFRNSRGAGFARQLLSVLDGLANESQREVCLMMTAMDVADMPPALIRSGRMEVWIEMALPDAAQRAEIIRRRSAEVSHDLGSFDADLIAGLCEGFTPADLRSLVDDAKSSVAYDMLTEEPARGFDDHLTEAANEISRRKALIAGVAQTIGAVRRAA